MIQLTAVSKAFGDRTLFDNVTWQISDRERVGLAGANGAGKTTLLRMLAGLDEPDSGGIVKPAAITVGYLPQDGLSHTGRTVYEEASLAFQPLLDMKAEMHRLEDLLAGPTVPEAEHQAMLDRYSDLQDRFRLHDGYSMDLRIGSVLTGLGFSQADLNRPTETFSGGWQMRIALAKLLLAAPGLLLLDEPTNHLDLEARNWLEGFLVGYPHAVILVSHDRFFLDAVIDRITEVSLRTLTDYPGNYSRYLVERDERVERLREAKRRQDEEVARVRLFIDRFRYKASKAAQVQSRVKMLEKVTPIEIPAARKRVRFSFPKSVRSGRTVLELQSTTKAYGDNVVLRNVSFHVERGDRIALVGPNGSGKSTLMRLLASVEPPDQGHRREGHQVVMQYFAQDEANRLDTALTVYETLAAGSPDQMIPAIRNILGGFLFSGDDVHKKVEVLSGGEKTRLAVARMLLRPANLLLLDEPTNHLDIDSKDVLLEALEDYGGTLVFVSHDRYFVERLATRIVEVGGGGIAAYPGTYEEFLWKKAHPEFGVGADPSLPVDGVSSGKSGRDSLSPGAGQPIVGTDGTAAAAKRAADREARKQEAAEARRRQRAAQALAARIADIEGRIAERERAIKEIEESMAEPGFYDDRAAAQPVIDRHQALMWEVGELMQEWEDLNVSASTAEPEPGAPSS
jgi:ATP-binding cassette, subfamily F, member 3